MKAEQQLEQSRQEERIREALNTHWQASAAGDANTEHDIYDDDAICDYPQSGERDPRANQYGVPQRQGRAREAVFRGSLRGAGLAEPMGSTDWVTLMSRRDLRTEPGVLTPGTRPENDPPCLSAVVSGTWDEGGKGRQIVVIDGSFD